jgi:hypothetical protein
VAVVTWERSQVEARCFQWRYLLSIDLTGWDLPSDEGVGSATAEVRDVRLPAPRAVVLIS